MISDWIFEDNLTAFLTIVAEHAGYDLLADETTAVLHGVRDSDSEAGRWYEYEFTNDRFVKLRFARDIGTRVVHVTFESDDHLALIAAVVIGILQTYHLTK
jgi:hypothetical protein